ncbi:MAG: zinc ABC transporter ATP-binding protein ZnuC [Pseudohongiellaceae bacterium]
MQKPVSQDSHAPPPLIKAENISLQINGRQILNNIGIEVRRGQIVTLIGPNGAGKTTLVRVLLGLLKPDSGSVVRQANLRVGYMPQRLHIDSTLPITVRRFLELAPAGDSRPFEALLKTLRIAHLANTQLRSVSGGELQRVLLARALMRNPDLLILDEPAQGVDIAGQAELYQLISHINDSFSCGILMISHDLHLVMSTTNEVVCLNHHICCHGKPEQVSNDPAYLELFGKKTVESLAIYTHRHNHSHGIDGQIVEPEHRHDDA